MADIGELTRLIEPEVKSLGYELVRIAMVGGRSDPTLQIMAERPDTRQLDLSDCETISRKLSDVLDSLEAKGSDPIEGSYRLEVSSPGIDRPLTRLKDFTDWAGHEARLNLKAEFEGRKRLTGTLSGCKEGYIVINVPGKGEMMIEPFEIASAKLLLTDDLINATNPLSTEGADLIKTEG